MANEQTQVWKPGEIITADKLNKIENTIINMNQNFISTKGSTISGDIVYKLTNVDLTQTNNGIDNKIYPAIAIFQDQNEKPFARVEGAVWSVNEEDDFKGSTWVTIWARNYKTSDGTEVTNALRLGVNKEGELLVKFTDKEKEAWRKALGIISEDYISLDNAIFHETGSTEPQSILTPLTTTHYFGGSSAGGQWWQGKNNALFRNTAKSSSEIYYPTISMDSPDGSWTIGTYKDNTLRFVYTLSSATSNTDVYNYSINTNGVFSGTAATANQLTTARTLTIGETGKSFNGTANVKWTLSEIGVAAANHTHSYLPLSGGTITGRIDTKITSWDNATAPSAARSYDTHYVMDVNNRTMSFQRMYHGVDNVIGVEYGVRRQISSSSTLWNTLTLRVGADGTRSVGVSDAAAWRTALGLGSMATQASSSYLPIGGGTMTGTITLANTGFKTSNAGGYVTDQYGNFKHQSTTANNAWTILNNAGIGTFAVNFERGAISKGKWESTPIGVIYGGTGATDTTSAQRNLGIDTGYISIGEFGGDTDAKKCKTATVNFNKAFSTAPNVVIGLIGGPANGNPAPKWGRVSVRVISNSITTTGFKYQVSAYGTDTFDGLGVCWVAVGQATIVA